MGMDEEVVTLIRAFQTNLRAAENAGSEGQKINHLVRAVRYAEAAFAILEPQLAQVGQMDELELERKTRYPCYVTGCRGEPHDGHTYSCCGKVGRISAHRPWCDAT